MNHCIQKYKLIAVAALLGCFSGCLQTASTSRDHNAVFDFGQRPRFFGSGSQTPAAPLPQLTGGVLGGQNEIGSLGGGLASIGNAPSVAKKPLAGLFAGWRNNSSPQSTSGPQGVNGNFGGQFEPSTLAQNQQLSQMATEVGNLSQRLSATDSDNQLLNTEVAGLRQKLELANQYNQTLKEQLADTSGRIQQTELEKQRALAQAEDIRQRLQQVAANNPNSQGFSGQFRQAAASDQPETGFDRFADRDSALGRGQIQFASATIRANNSLMRRLSEINIPGGDARMDGDVIRIEFPSDRLFVPGTYQITPSQRPLLSEVVATVRRSFPRQIIGVEAHWDNTPLNPPGTTDHQLTATQSLAVFEELIRLGLPRRQLFTMGMASNRPRHAQSSSGGVSPNRRIELVIYPESYDGS
jgi:flagellar motor protein MotB